MALYLKYRPQSLDELVGQTQVKQLLKGAFESNRLSHAYLFVGPRGTGKTSTARILAKMVNCELVQSPELVVDSKDKNATNYELRTTNVPCNKCSTCISITDGSNLDLIEIDAASNRGIDDMRQLRERIKLTPTAAKKKVYIIDEVHMLTTEAFNALLKTLEEPPSHALFILATTEVQKVPQTIISRVQRLDFKLAKPEELRQALERITAAEKIEIEEEALKLIIKKAEGSFRDAVKLLDQVVSIGEKITLKVIQENLKISQVEESLTFIQYLSGKDTTNSLKLILDQVEKGADIKDFTLHVMDIFRSLIFIKNGLGDALVSPNYMEEKYKNLVDLSVNFSNQDLVKILDTLQSAIEKLKFASIQSLPMELAVIEICEKEPSAVSHQPVSTQRGESSEKTELIESVIAIRQLAEKQSTSAIVQTRIASSLEATRNDDVVISSSLSLRAEGLSVAQQSEGSLARHHEVRSTLGVDASTSNELRDSSLIVQNDKIDKIADIPILSTQSDSSDILKLKEKWTFVLETVRQYNFSLEALLRQVNIKECTVATVILEVPYSFHQRILESPKNRDMVESLLIDILGRNVRISIILSERPRRLDDIANVDIAADDEIIRAAAEIFSSDSVN